MHSICDPIFCKWRLQPFLLAFPPRTSPPAHPVLADTGGGFCRWYSWENRLADGFSHSVKFRLPSDIMEISDYQRLSHAITQSGRFDSLLLRLPLESRPLWPVSPWRGNPETGKPGEAAKTVTSILSYHPLLNRYKSEYMFIFEHLLKYCHSYTVIRCYTVITG
jgi:hypothetical protein